jgi:tol-pal system protein YbgF
MPLLLRFIAGGFAFWLLVHTAAAAEDRSRSNPQEPARLADLYYQLQQLQQEIMELRGQVEEQSYRVRRLEKQRLEDYEDFDRRLRAGGQGSSSVRPPTAASGGPAASKPAASSSPSASSKKAVSATERAAYQKGFQQLKRQQLDLAQASFNAYIGEYPDGQYTANAYYWLGEVYLTKNDLPKARAAFDNLVKRYPDYRKTPESSYKLATIYDQMGDEQKSKALLQKIVREYGETSPTTVSQASAYLDKHFR